MTVEPAGTRPPRGASPPGLWTARSAARIARGRSRTDAGSAWRGAAIVAIKLIHSAIFLVNAVSVLHVFWAGVSGRRSRWTGFALAAALTESAVFVANRGRCPLTGLVEDLGAESGRVSDIFLPRWLADRIPLLFAPPLALGLLGLLVDGRRWSCGAHRGGFRAAGATMPRDARA